MPASALLGLMLLARVTAAVPAGVPPAAAAPELNPDRPDATESPFTVEAGRLQLEFDVSRFSRDRTGGVRTTEWVVAPFNLRLGVTGDTEAGIFFDPYVRQTEQVRGGPKTTVQGRGDLTLRGKKNFLGNGGGEFAAGVIVDLILPTSAKGVGNDRVEGAVTFPVAYDLPGGWEGGAMTSVGSTSTNSGRRAVWTNSMTFAHALGSKLGGFLELASTSGEGAHVLVFNCGLTRRMGSDLQLDCGLNIGVSRAAPDLGVFAGATRRY